MHPHINSWGSLLRLYGRSCGFAQKINKLLLGEDEYCSDACESDLQNALIQNRSLSCQTENPVLDKGVLVKPNCNSQATEMTPTSFIDTEIQVEVSTSTVPIQVDKRYLMSDASTQWDTKIMGGPSAFPPIERALRIRPLIYADGLYYHRATQTDWRGQSLFHKATQFPEKEYRDADKEVGSANIQILTSDSSSQAMMMPGLASSVPYPSMMNYGLMGAQMMMMPPNMVAPVPMMGMADSTEMIGDNSSFGEPSSVHELDTRSLSSTGSPVIPTSGNTSTSPQYKPKVPMSNQSCSPQATQRSAEASPRHEMSRFSPQKRQGDMNISRLSHPLVPNANMMRYPPPSFPRQQLPIHGGQVSPKQDVQQRNQPPQHISGAQSQSKQLSINNQLQSQLPRLTGQQSGIGSQGVNLHAQQQYTQYQQPYMYQPGWYNYMPTWQ